MMTVEEKPDITYNDIGGQKEEIQKLREVRQLPRLHPNHRQHSAAPDGAVCARLQVLELPMLHPERFVELGIDPPKVPPPHAPLAMSPRVPSVRASS
jgi:26S proteasome regulatory subunit T1